MTSAAESLPVIVLGGTGYVAGELLRLLAGHPHFGPVTIVSDSRPGGSVAHAFPQLACAYRAHTFVGFDDALALAAGLRRGAIFSAAPHGVSAALIGRLLEATAGSDVRIVDISADHRFAAPDAYAAVYGAPLASQAQLAQFTCAVPEHVASVTTRHVAHPGCFATAMLLALVPLVAHDLIEPDVYISGITGSTGSGRSPTAGTHHPDRHSDLYAYKPLGHRHAPEVEAVCLAATGRAPRVHFVPHSGPFARGIHVTLQARLRAAHADADVNAVLASYYADSRFVDVLDHEPHIKHVVASNYAALRATRAAGHVAVLSVLDNLTKGAAGGAIQWMNRLQGLPEDAGLGACAAGWT